MGFIAKLSIKRKLIYILMLTSGLTLLLVSIIFIASDIYRLRGSLIDEFTCQAEILAHNTAVALAFNDTNTTEIILSSLKYKHSVVSAIVFDNNKEVFAVYYRDDVVEKTEFPQFQNGGYWFEKGNLYVFQKIYLDDDFLGTLYIQSDLRLIEETVIDYSRLFLVILLMAGIAAYILSARLQRMISSPIINLASTAKIITKDKNYSIRAEKQTDDEVGGLVEAFNDMLEQIQIREKQRDKAYNAVHSSETRYRNLFEDSPISLWEEDFSAVKIYIDDLKRSRVEDFERYFNDNPDAVRECASMVKITDINRTTLKMLKFETKDELLTSLGVIFRQESYDIFKKELIALAGGETVFETETVNLTSDNHEIYVIFRLSVVSGYDDWSKIFISILDISKRKEMERELKRERDFEKTLIDNARVIICVLDNDDNFILVNPYMEEISGYKSAELIGHSWIESLFPSDDQGEVKQFFAEVLSDTNISSKTFPIVSKKGEIRAIEWYDSTLRDEKGKLTGHLMIGQDITERLQAAEALKKAHDELEIKVEERTEQLTTANIRLRELDKLKSMFIASMSHELRTPLNSIIGFTGILLMGMTGPVNEEQKKQLGMVKNSANHLLALINDVIDVSKIEAGRIELDIHEFDLVQAVQEIYGSFTVISEAKKIGISLNLPDKITLISDERRVKQIVMNLVSNAVKFTDKGGVTISLNGDGESIKISVADTGMGIEEKNLEKLFKAFSRIYVEGILKEGTGLGLYLSNKIANLLGGDLTAKSEFQKGSEFILSLPVKYSAERS